jgi:hypothetical protein
VVKKGIPYLELLLNDEVINKGTTGFEASSWLIGPRTCKMD